MIGPGDERPKHEAPEDWVTIELCDLDRGACAFLRVLRSGAGTSVAAIAFLEGRQVAAVDDPASVLVETAEPLARWSCRFEHGATVLEAELVARSKPIALDEVLAGAAGFSRYEQLCDVRGEIRAGGGSTQIDGVGRRAHFWGDRPSARFRSVYAVAGDRAITVAAVRPPGAEDHGAELISAHLIRPESEPERFEDARISTVYEASGQPRTAGLELFLEGDDYPRRASGEAVCRVAAAGDSLESACFRWSLDGDPAQGGYQVVPPA